jgi:transposase
MGSNQRKHTAQFKAQVVLEVLRGEISPAEACRIHKLHISVLSRWRREFLESAHQAFEIPSEQVEDQERIAELERMVGQLTMQLEIAKKASRLLNRNKDGSW